MLASQFDRRVFKSGRCHEEGALRLVMNPHPNELLNISAPHSIAGRVAFALYNNSLAARGNSVQIGGEIASLAGVTHLLIAKLFQQFTNGKLKFTRRKRKEFTNILGKTELTLLFKQPLLFLKAFLFQALLFFNKTLEFDDALMFLPLLLLNALLFQPLPFLQLLADALLSVGVPLALLVLMIGEPLLLIMGSLQLLPLVKLLLFEVLAAFIPPITDGEECEGDE